MKRLLHSDLESIRTRYRTNDPVYKLGIRFAIGLWIIGGLIVVYILLQS